MLYLYSLGISFVLLVLLLCLYFALTSVCYLQRARILAHLSEPMRQRLVSMLRRVVPTSYSRLDMLDWNSAVQAGFTSSLFDIEANIQENDPRAGLDEAGMHQIHQMMHTQGLVRRTANHRRSIKRGCNDTMHFCASRTLIPTQVYPLMRKQLLICRLWI